jgi:hypothetical protein
MGFKNIDIGQIGERGLVGDDARETRLILPAKQTKTQRVRNRPLNDLDRHAGRPVAARQEFVDRLKVQAIPVRCD